jgi:hypothetical protein
MHEDLTPSSIRMGSGQVLFPMKTIITSVSKLGDPHMHFDHEDGVYTLMKSNWPYPTLTKLV